MSYRTYINNTQVFGNNERYPEWIKYVESKGITVGEEGDYEGELDDFMEALDVVESIVMRLESERRERKKKGEKFFNQSIFDLGDIYNEVVEDPEEESLRRHPRIQRSFLERKTYKNFQVEGRLQDQSKCRLMERCVCLNITGIFHV